MNALNVKTRLFNLYLNISDFDKAQEIWNEIKSHPFVSSNPYGSQAIMSEYQLAYLYFLTSDYQQAMIQLNKCDELNKLNKTWYWASLLLEVVILIEQELFEIAENRLKNLRRLLSRDKHSAPRIRHISNILNEALKNHSEVRKVLISHMTEDKNVIGIPPSDPFGYEIVAFERWIEQYTSASKAAVHKA